MLVSRKLILLLFLIFASKEISAQNSIMSFFLGGTISAFILSIFNLQYSSYINSAVIDSGFQCKGVYAMNREASSINEKVLLIAILMFGVIFLVKKSNDHDRQVNMNRNISKLSLNNNMNQED